MVDSGGNVADLPSEMTLAVTPAPVTHKITKREPHVPHQGFVIINATLFLRKKTHLEES